MNTRIKYLRKQFDLTQSEFGERIGIRGNTVATYEIGERTPSNAVITAICKEFGVNREWLVDGIGEPYRDTTEREMIEKLVNDCEHSDVLSAIVKTLLALNPDQLDTLGAVLLGFAKNYHDGLTIDEYLSTGLAVEPDDQKEQQ